MPLDVIVLSDISQEVKGNYKIILFYGILFPKGNKLAKIKRILGPVK